MVKLKRNGKLLSMQLLNLQRYLGVNNSPLAMALIITGVTLPQIRHEHVSAW